MHCTYIKEVATNTFTIILHEDYTIDSTKLDPQSLFIYQRYLEDRKHELFTSSCHTFSQTSTKSLVSWEGENQVIFGLNHTKPF